MTLEETAPSYARGGSGWILGKFFFSERVVLQTGWSGKWWSHHPWWCSWNVRMWHLETLFSENDGVQLIVGLDYLRGLSNCNDAMILWFIKGTCTTLPQYVCSVMDSRCIFSFEHTAENYLLFLLICYSTLTFLLATMLNPMLRILLNIKWNWRKYSMPSLCLLN